MTEPASPLDTPDCWPTLRLAEWQATCDTLHMWTQIVGKVRLAVTPRVNHWWNVPLYITPHGLTTSSMPHGRGAFQIDFDFVRHELALRTSDQRTRVMPLVPQSVADFYRAFDTMLCGAGIEVRIWTMPVEVPAPIRFDNDTVHASYDREAVERFSRVLVTVARVFETFRSTFVGKCSPVHFFRGSFDLAVTRFSGRPAPPRAGADAVTREAYSHEVSSVGFWPGSGTGTDAAFYAYTAPEPREMRERRIEPAAARYHPELGECVLTYDAVRTAPSPTAALLAFCESTYAAGASAGGWDREALDRGDPG